MPQATTSEKTIEATASSRMAAASPAADIPDRVASAGRSVRGWRFVRAYRATFTVIASYVWLGLRSRIYGRTWRSARIGDAHRRNAQRVYATIVQLQGLFIKVGQLLAIMANFLPPEFRAELEALQDQVPPRPYSEIASRLEIELGARMSQFASFDREPIASASLGQVHGARLVDGRRVCVKVQHLDIDRIVRLDLKMIRRIMAIVQWFVPVRGLDAYYFQIKELLTQEIDFALEADNI
ncbi:MAG: AarF/UbiB family protein [Polyangiaceae bacterium]